MSQLEPFTLAEGAVPQAATTARFAEAVGTLADLQARGAIAYDADLSTGLEAAPGAIASLYAGENTGKTLIYIG